MNPKKSFTTRFGYFLILFFIVHRKFFVPYSRSFKFIFIFLNVLRNLSIIYIIIIKTSGC